MFFNSFFFNDNYYENNIKNILFFSILQLNQYTFLEFL